MSFGEDVAEMYGDVLRGDEDAAGAFLGELAAGGPALELAIGAGRIALPLAARGFLRDSTVIKLIPEESVVKLHIGDQIRLTAKDFERLSAAFFAR